MDVEELSSDEEKENNIEEPSVDPHQKMSLLQESLRNAMMAQRTQLSQVVAEAMKTMYTPLAAQLSEIVRNMAKTIMASYQPDLSGLAEAARHMLVDLGETLKGITFATISEEQKEQLLQAHKQWGEYGWTINPNASVDTLFDSAPSDKKTADQIALKECSNASMKSVFKSISEMKHSKKIDFEEAVFDFDNRKYKSCALMQTMMMRSLSTCSSFNAMLCPVFFPACFSGFLTTRNSFSRITFCARAASSSR